jgi:hypothetical protein
MAALEQQGSVPVPDPTKLTTDAVALAKLDMEKLFDTKLNGFRELVIEKFSGRDTALAAALKAAQELVKQQNDSNTLANDKMEKSFATQITNLDTKITDLKDAVSAQATRNWAAVGGYILGACGIAAFIVDALLHHGQ